jgi:predicted house-cleaning noncanonical NTP pyrophosphatase (MazG superfamily)
MKKTLNNQKVGKLYYSAIEEFKPFLTQKINENWEALSEDKKLEYNEIAFEAMQKAAHSDEFSREEL